MTKVRRERPEGVSLYGVLMVLSGAIFLVCTVRFKWPRQVFGADGVLIFMASMAAVVAWGIKDVLGIRFSTPVVEKGLRLRRGGVSVQWQWVFYLAIMAVCFAGSLLGRSNMLMLVFSILAGPFILNGWMAHSILYRIDVRRRLPPRAMAGMPTAVEVIVENRKRFASSWLLTVDDHIQNDEERLETGVLFARVPPKCTRTAHYQLRLMQRGKYTLGPLKLATRFPLGLVERSRLFDVYGEIIIHPRLGRFAAAWKRNHLMANELVNREDRRRGVFDDEFHGIREYRGGDNPRAIHWRTSARRNELMVREFHQSRDQNLCLLLDLWQPVRPAALHLEAVELAVSLAATMCVEQMRRSGDSDLFLFAGGADLTRWEGHSRPRNIESLLDVLAMVRAGATNDVRRLMKDAAGKRGIGTRTILVTTRLPDAGTIPGLEHASSRAGRDGGGDLTIIHAQEDSVSRFFQLS